MSRTPCLGFVVIGRNEGERLPECFASLPRDSGPIVYVDSGSTDDSLLVAAAAGADVVSLDNSSKFTAARARNAGLLRLKEIFPQVELVQFVDGDCQVAAGWPETASRWLATNQDYAVVSGARREQFAEKSVYNYLCELEWQAPVGDVLACGGDAMIRVAAFEEVGGYNAALIAGEEPELCFRLRAAGWKIRRLEAAMGLHDAAMTRLSQWWRRSRRAGYAYASGAYLHGRSAEAYCVRECASIVLWAAAVPAALLLASAWLGWAAAWLLLVYPANVARIRSLQRGSRRSWPWAAFVMLGKFPEMQGLLEFVIDRCRGRDGVLIEYK